MPVLSENANAVEKDNQELESTHETERREMPIMPGLKRSQTQKILRNTVRNAKNLRQVYKNIDTDMNNLVKNFRVNFMKQLRSKPSTLSRHLDLSDEGSEPAMTERQITPLSVPTYAQQANVASCGSMENFLSCRTTSANSTRKQQTMKSISQTSLLPPWTSYVKKHPGILTPGETLVPQRVTHLEFGREQSKFLANTAHSYNMLRQENASV